MLTSSKSVLIVYASGKVVSSSGSGTAEPSEMTLTWMQTG